MRFGGAVADLTGKVAELYREIVTTTVRFEDLQRNVADTMARVERRLDRLEERFTTSHDECVRARAASEAEIRAVDARLTSLSEAALHAVAREAAREALRVLPSSNEEDGSRDA